MLDRRRSSKQMQASREGIAGRIEEVVTAIRLEAERRELGAGTIVISAERLREIMRRLFLA
jgi:hypothetical protein